MGVTRRSLLAAPFLRLPLRSAARRTNVVAFMTDDHGAWAMGAYGCRDMHTPVLDQLAAEGARFTRAYACTPGNSPSRMSYLTGLIPSQHGVQDDLVDELYLGIVPTMIGEGIPALPPGFPQREFALVENKSYSKGLIGLRYERARKRKGRKQQRNS